MEYEVIYITQGKELEWLAQGNRHLNDLATIETSFINTISMAILPFLVYMYTPRDHFGREGEHCLVLIKFNVGEMKSVGA